jgi:hypothetical protein
MGWRVRLNGAAPDLDRLRRELATGDVVVRGDDQGTYLQATIFESFTDGDQVVPVAEALIVRLNGIFSLSGGYQQVSFSGRVERDESAWVYVSDAAGLVDVMLTADGVVTGADGVVKSSSGPSQSMRQLMPPRIIQLLRRPIESLDWRHHRAGLSSTRFTKFSARRVAVATPNCHARRACPSGESRS